MKMLFFYSILKAKGFVTTEHGNVQNGETRRQYDVSTVYQNRVEWGNFDHFYWYVTFSFKFLYDIPISLFEII